MESGITRNELSFVLNIERCLYPAGDGGLPYFFHDLLALSLDNRTLVLFSSAFSARYGRLAGPIL